MIRLVQYIRTTFHEGFVDVDVHQSVPELTYPTYCDLTHCYLVRESAETVILVETASFLETVS